jgi:hypothetical protein
MLDAHAAAGGRREGIALPGDCPKTAQSRLDRVPFGDRKRPNSGDCDHFCQLSLTSAAERCDMLREVNERQIISCR